MCGNGITLAPISAKIRLEIQNGRLIVRNEGRDSRHQWIRAIRVDGTEKGSRERRRQQAHRGDPPWPLDIDRGGCGAKSQDHLVAIIAPDLTNAGARWVDQEVSPTVVWSPAANRMTYQLSIRK